MHYPSRVFRKEDWAVEVLERGRHDLARARVIRAPRDQVEVLPTIPGDQIFAHVSAVGIPFPSTYVDLDMAGLHADLAPEIYVDVFNDGYKDCAAAGCLITDRDGTTSGIVFIHLKGDKVTNCWPVATFKALGPDERPPEMDGIDNFGVATLMAVVGTEGAVPMMKEHFPDDMEVNPWWALIAMAGIERAIAVLYMIEAANVELVERAESRQSRRQAERKGEQISLQVVVRPPKRRRQDAIIRAPGDPRKFSHRFEVRGVYHHVTRGPHVADPSNLKPCPVWRERHEHSELCRREWVPPFVKGPEDVPLVPKRRVLAS